MWLLARGFSRKSDSHPATIPSAVYVGRNKEYSLGKPHVSPLWPKDEHTAVGHLINFFLLRQGLSN